MKLIVPHKSFEVIISNFDFKFKGNWKYIAPDSFVDAMNVDPNVMALVQVFDFENKKELKEKIDYTGKKLLITRTGGRGDFHFILRSIKQIKDEFKDVHVTLCCGSRYFQSTKMLFQDLVDVFKEIPCTTKDYDDCDYMYTFEGYIEINELAKTINAFELMAMKFFIELKGDYGLPLKIYSKYLDQADELIKSWPTVLKGDSYKIIGIQPKASAIMRTYPFEYQAQLIKWFNDIGYHILMLDSKITIDEVLARKEFKELKILTPYNDEIKGSFELSVALTKKCSLIIAPDSAFTYVADTFNIPAIIIYGPFSSELRAKNLNIYAIDTLHGCYNCCIHQELPCKYSDDIYSPCLKKIEPKLVFETAKQILDKTI